MNLNGVWRLGICTDEEYRKLKLEIKDLETLEKKGNPGGEWYRSWQL